MNIGNLESVIKNLLESGSENLKSDFYNLTYKKLYGYCLILTNHSEFADDVLHDTYIKAFRSLKNLKNPSKCNAWLRVIAKNIFLDSHKKSYKKNEIGIFDDTTSITDTSEAYLKHDIITTLESLSPDDRELIYLIDMEGMGYKSASEVIGISEEALKSRIFRARKKFIEIYNSETIVSLKSSG